MLWGDGSRAEGAWLMLPSSISSPLLSAFGISISDLVDDLGGGMAITEHKAEVIGFDTPPHARKGGRKEFFSPRRGTEWWWVLLGRASYAGRGGEKEDDETGEWLCNRW